MQRCAGGILLEGDRILLGRRRAGRAYGGLWDVIGGRCAPGESDEQTLVRELMEEVGVVPLRYRSLGVFDDPPDRPAYRLHLFVIDQWEGTPSNCSDEHTEVTWHDLSSATALALSSPKYVEIFESLLER